MLQYFPTEWKLAKDDRSEFRLMLEALSFFSMEGQVYTPELPIQPVQTRCSKYKQA